MVTGIDASITSITDGTTAHATDVIASLNSLNANGVSNDGGLITTDNAGTITAVGFSATGPGGLEYFLMTPYQILNNVTINAGSTNTYTCTGVGTPTVPSEAKGIIVGGYFASTGNGAYLQLFPHGVTITNISDYPLWIVQGANNTSYGQARIRLVSGQIDIKAVNTQCTGINISIHGYII
jgi:hypothetical protein